MTGWIVLEICTLLVLITPSEGLTGGGVVKAALKAGRLEASESDSEGWSPSAYPKKVQDWLLPDLQEAEKLRAEQAAAIAAVLEGPGPHGRAQTSSTMSFTSERLFPEGLSGGTVVVAVPQLVLPGPRPQFTVPAPVTTSTAAPTTSTAPALASTASTSSAATSAAARSTADATTSRSSPSTSGSSTATEGSPKASTTSSSTATKGSAKVSTTSGSSTSTEAAVLSASSSRPAPGASTAAPAVVSTSTGASTTPGAAGPAVSSSTGTLGIAAEPLASSTTQLAEGSSTLAALTTSSSNERVSQVSSPAVPPGVGSPGQTALRPIAEPPGQSTEPPGTPEPRAKPPFLDSNGITKGERQVPSAEPKVWERGLLPFGSPTSGASPTPFNGSAPQGGPEAAPLSSPLIAQATGVPSPASAFPQGNLPPSPAALKNGVQTSQAAEASKPRKLTATVAPPPQEPIPPGASALSTPAPPEEAAAAKAPAAASPQKEAAASKAPAVPAPPHAQNKARPVGPLLGAEGRAAEARAQVPMAAAPSTGPKEANAAAPGEAITGPGPAVVGPEAIAASGAPPSAIPSPLPNTAAQVISIPPGVSNVPAAATSSHSKGPEALLHPSGLSNGAPALAAAPSSPRKGPEALSQASSSTTPRISLPPGPANVAAAAPGLQGPGAPVPPPGLPTAAGLAAAPRKGPGALPEAAPVTAAKAQPEEPLLGLSGSPGHADLGPVAPPGNVTGNATGFEGEKQEEQSSVIVDGMNVTTIVKVVTKVIPLSTTGPARYGG